MSDLVVYFVRRIFGLLKQGGSTAFVTTNSIKDGDIRKDGLGQVLAQGGTINMAVRGVKWPGRANLVVSLVAIHKGEWSGTRHLDGFEVPVISPHFEALIDAGEPVPLKENLDKIHEGSKNRGEGFFITHAEAQDLIDDNCRNADVVFPILSGGEITDIPDQSPRRSTIFFADWDEATGRTYDVLATRKSGEAREIWKCRYKTEQELVAF